MTCAEVTSRLSAYYDGELDGVAEQIGLHLAVCPGCSAYLRDLGQIGTMLRSGSADQVPPGLWERTVAAAQDARPPTHWGIRRWLVRGAALAAGFIIYVLGYQFFVSSLDERQVAEGPLTENVLRETSLALAGMGPIANAAPMLVNQPEFQLFKEIQKDVTP